MPEYRSVGLTKLQTVLDSSKRSFQEQKKRGPVRDPDREEALGLKWKRGDKVKDKVTGKGGEILAGTRRAIEVSRPRSEG